MLATDVLMKNHRSILELFDRYRRAARGDYRKKKELFDSIKRAVRLHLCLEEEMLYPAMTRTPSPEAGRALDGVLQEHLFIDDALSSLSQMRPQDREYDGLMTMLRRRVEDHLRLEQSGPYEEIRRALKREALEKLGAEISARIDLLARVALPLS
jgi:hemerythrin-like domain-containing protein